MNRVTNDRFDRLTSALVFKLGRYRLHHGGVAVIRTLGRARLRVYGVHEDRFAPAATSRYLYGGFVWPTARDSVDPDQLVRGLTEIASQISQPCVVIPTDDQAAIFLDSHRAQLPDQFILPAFRPGLVRRLVDKRSCAELARQAGLSAPTQTVLRCPVPNSTLAGIALPVVVKRAERTLLADGTHTFSTIIVHTREHLSQILQDFRAEPYDIVVQELFPGDDWLYHGYCNAQSDALVSFTGRKLRSRPAYAGESAYARAETNRELRETVEQFLKGLGYTGPVSMDLRYDKHEDTFKLLDVNPRVGACFRLFVNAHGIDVVRALHLDLTNRDVPQGAQQDGRTYLVENYDHEVRRAYQLGSSVSWLGQLSQADELAWLQRDDLVPALVAGVQLTIGEPSLSKPHQHTFVKPRFFRGRGFSRLTS